MGKLIYGVGVSEDGEFKRTYKDENGKRKNTREYKLWKGMLDRCYSSKFHIKNPTYIGCSVSDNFKNFQWFARWCQNQIGFSNQSWQLDKDIICRGNKHYSEETCVFAPTQINSIVLGTNSKRGLYPIGVAFNKQRGYFISLMKVCNKSVYLGKSDTIEDAFSLYKVAKENHIRKLAEEFKDIIDPRLYKALMEYQVNITD